MDVKKLKAEDALLSKDKVLLHTCIIEKKLLIILNIKVLADKNPKVNYRLLLHNVGSCNACVTKRNLISSTNVPYNELVSQRLYDKKIKIIKM